MITIIGKINKIWQYYGPVDLKAKNDLESFEFLLKFKQTMHRVRTHLHTSINEGVRRLILMRILEVLSPLPAN